MSTLNPNVQVLYTYLFKSSTKIKVLCTCPNGGVGFLRTLDLFFLLYLIVLKNSLGIGRHTASADSNPDISQASGVCITERKRRDKLGRDKYLNNIGLYILLTKKVAAHNGKYTHPSPRTHTHTHHTHRNTHPHHTHTHHTPRHTHIPHTQAHKQ